MKYLYGASIQGIQKYIFQTNELKDIVGASELVNQICEDFVERYSTGGEMIVHAAGNIKCIFDNEDACRRAVRDFPKHAMEEAPGITISQAVVKFENDSDYSTKAEELESRLHAQRNRPVKSLTTGLMSMERSRTTGLPATTIEYAKDKNKEKEKDAQYLDEGTVAKRNAKDGGELYRKLTGDNVKCEHRPYDTKDLTDRNDWIAVIHADGNGLGEVVAAIHDPDKMHEFSDNLDKATVAAAQAAYATIKKEDEEAHDTWKKLPIRPVVIGGDDLTVICRGDLAVRFVEKYLEAFEKETNERIGQKLTACAGIAFIKSSYPFYYGYDLAEALCGEAKKDAKSDKVKEANGNQAPSCLMFHKVQSSFVEDYAEIKRKELTTVDKGSLCFGPYYLTEQTGRWTIGELSKVGGKLSDEKNNRVKTAIRQWLTLMHEDAGAAVQHTNRVLNIIDGDKSIYNSATKGIIRKEGTLYPAYDILSLLTITQQETKPNQETK